jgi:hypothetical protein
MKLSAGFALVGLLFLALQLIWAPGEDVPMALVFVPLMLGVLSLVVSVALGVTRGSTLYRVAVVVGLLGVVAIVAAVILPLDRGVAGPRSIPTNGEIVLVLGIVLSVLSAITGAIAIARRGGTGAPGHRPGSSAI